MFFLTRKEFPDRWLRPANLQSCFALWGDLYHRSRAQAGVRKPGFCSLQAEVWGFPRAQGEAYLQAALRHLEALGLAEVQVELRDPDTLRITAPVSLAEPFPDLAPWISLCLGELFNGLCCSFRVTVKDSPEPGEQISGVGNTLVLAGALHGGGFLLKGLWPTGRDGREEQLYEPAPWPNESAFLELLDTPRTEAAALPEWAASLFPGAGMGRVEKVLVWFLTHQDRKIGGFLARVAVSGSAAVACGLLVLWLRPISPFVAWGMAAPAAVLALAALGFTLWLKGMYLFGCRYRMRAGFQRLYSQSIDHVPVDLQALPASSDPSVRKYSGDLEALGCTHHRDVTVEPPLSGRFYTRIYLLPEGHTYLCLSFMYSTDLFQVFPAKPIFLVTTYLADGTRVVSADQGMGYRKPLPLPVIARKFPGANDPEAIIRCHRELLRKLQEQGRSPVPLDPGTILERMAAEHEESRPLMARTGYYTWGDAFHEAFDVVRREYRD